MYYYYYLRKVLLLLLLFFISFMKIIYNYRPQRKHISSATYLYSFVRIFYLQINASSIIIIIIINIILLPQTSHVSRYRRSFATMLWLQHTVHLMLFPILSVFYLHITTYPNNCAVPSTYFLYVVLSR